MLKKEKFQTLKDLNDLWPGAAVPRFDFGWSRDLRPSGVGTQDPGIRETGEMRLRSLNGNNNNNTININDTDINNTTNINATNMNNNNIKQYYC